MNKKKQETDESNELSDYVKELIKPENLQGPFSSTEELMKSLWDEEN